MKKYYLMPLLIVTTFLIFNSSAKQLKGAKVNFVTQNVKSTLDSLQGTWKNDNDSSYLLKFSNDTLITFFENEEISTSKLYFSQEFTEDEKSLKSLIYNNNFGSYMVHKDTETNIILCYKIEFLTNKDLTFEYRGRLINFHK